MVLFSVRPEAEPARVVIRLKSLAVRGSLGLVEECNTDPALMDGVGMQGITSCSGLDF